MCIISDKQRTQPSGPSKTSLNFKILSVCYVCSGGRFGESEEAEQSRDGKASLKHFKGPMSDFWICLTICIYQVKTFMLHLAISNKDSQKIAVLTYVLCVFHIVIFCIQEFRIGLS